MKNISELNRSKPLVFFDLETTGIDTNSSKIVEISVVKYDLSMKKTTFDTLINPEVDIPVEASEVHGITNDTVVNAPVFGTIAQKLFNDFIKGSIICGFNSDRFDIPLLHREFFEVGVEWDLMNTQTIDVRNIYVKNEGRSLTDAYREYCNKELVDAHQASADTYATIEIFEQQLARYEDMPRNSKDLSKYASMRDDNAIDIGGKFIRGSDGDVYFNFGKYVGFKATIDRSYLDWIITKSNMTSEVKLIAKKIYEGKHV